MKINRYFVSAEKNDKIQTEILYYLASVRAERCEILVILFENEIDKVLACAIKILKSLKQKGSIDFFIESSALESSTEGSYILNKYPDIVSALENNRKSFVIKL